MSVDNLLSRLDKVRRTGPDTWLACCPAHEDSTASLSVRDADGKTLVHCFAGCTVHEVVAAAGLELQDLFPPRPADGRHAVKGERRPFPASDALRAVASEAFYAAAACVAMAAGEPVDRDRLITAASRISAALRSSGVQP
jgi:hypothetical protein